MSSNKRIVFMTFTLIITLLFVTFIGNSVFCLEDSDTMTIKEFMLEAELLFMPGELIVSMNNNINAGEFLLLIPDIDIESIYELGLGVNTKNSIFLISLTIKTDEYLFMTAEALLSRHDVKYVSPNVLLSYLSTPIPKRFLLAKAGDPEWDEASNMDLNNDGIIDIEDLILLQILQR